jgi:hypothetical protein
MVDVYEFYDATFDATSKQLFAKHTMIKNNMENFPWEDYVLTTATKKCLTDKTQTTKIRSTDYATLRFLNANPARDTYLNYTSRPYVWRISIVDTSGNIADCEILIGVNPHWYTSIPMNPSTSTWVLDDHNKLIAPRLLEIGVGPKNLENLNFRMDWYNGVNIVATLPGTTLQQSNIDYYEIYASKSSPVINQVSKKYRYEMICSSNKYNANAIQIQWENLQGGFDNFLFTKVNTKTNSIAGTTMLKNKYQQGHNSNTSSMNFIGANSYDRGYTQIYNEQITTYNMNTDWVTDLQMQDLESLWQSNSIFANISGTFYPVISLSDKQIINTNSRGLKIYSFDIQLSNSKYNS